MLTAQQYAQIIRLAHNKYGPTAMGPFVSWKPSAEHWVAHVFIIVDGKIKRAGEELGPFESSDEAFKGLTEDLILHEDSGSRKTVPSKR